VGGIEALPFSVLVFVFGSLLLVNAWGVIDAKFAVSSASREASRTYAESTGPASGDRAARDVAAEVIRNYGRDPDRLELEGPHGELARCGVVGYTASYPVPAIRIPVLGGFGTAFEVRSTHATRVDALGAGLPANGSCGP
jgi:hypothetical protein